MTANMSSQSDIIQRSHGRFPLLICTAFCYMTFSLVISATCPTEKLVPVQACLSDTEMITSALNVSDVANPTECAADCLRLSPCIAYSVQFDLAGGAKCYFYKDFVRSSSSSSCSGDTTSHYNMVNGKCGDNGIFNSTSSVCKCYNSHVGDRCQRLMKDCTEGYVSGHYTDEYGTFQIWPVVSPTSFPVLCLMKYGGRTLIQIQISDINFTKSWDEYRNGFGNNEKTGHWLGLEKIYQLTNSRPMTLVVVVWNISTWSAISYSNFVITNESWNYTFTFNNAWPNSDHPLGDCLKDLQGNAFSTPDNDNDGNPDVNCASVDQAGWWYGINCSQCNVNGKVKSDPPHQPGDAYWYPGSGDIYIDHAYMFLI